MNRRSFLVAGAAFAALSATAAFADEDYVKDIVAFLKTHGYTDIAVSRTLLGRVRIIAVNSKGKRELICNPRTGEILRDVIITADGDMRPPMDTGTPRSGSIARIVAARTVRCGRQWRPEHSTRAPGIPARAAVTITAARTTRATTIAMTTTIAGMGAVEATTTIRDMAAAGQAEMTTTARATVPATTRQTLV